MEEYVIQTNNEENTVKFSEYSELVYTKHKMSYGEKSANEIRERMRNIFKDALSLLKKPEKHNMLLIGKVQSGKTSNLEMFTALAFDNGFNLMILYGGYDDTLLSQTNERFKTTFNIPTTNSLSNDCPLFFSTNEKINFEDFDDSIFEEIVSLKKPVIMTAMKRPKALSKINDLLSRIDKTHIHAFIIDDEGDQASLNTKRDKKNDGSATYLQIKNMKQVLNNPLYLSVTATPQANIFQSEFSELIPSDLRLIESGNGHCGAAMYHLGYPDMIGNVEEEDNRIIESGRMPQSLRNAVNYYLVAAGIMKTRGCEGSDMVVHSHKLVSIHRQLCSVINSLLESYKHIVNTWNKDLKILRNELKTIYDKEVNNTVKVAIPFNDELFNNICLAIKGSYVYMKNGPGNSQTLEGLKKYRIFIGGDLLQRGVTFKNLVVTYFTRWANSGNMDTTLQRARWFGYRNKYIDICKIFTTDEIAKEFTNLADTEIDLWDQFEAVQNGELNIADILINADETTLKPTRPSVVKFKRINFVKRWTKQQLGIFDKFLIQRNNAVVEKFINENNFIDTSMGRTDGNSSAKYQIVNSKDVIEFISAFDGIFDMSPFNRKALLEEIASFDTVPIILMNNERKRKFDYQNRINNIHQGPDKTEVDERKYNGDAEVVIDKSKINIQIHNILPKKDADEPEFKQYMFAIFAPKTKSYFMMGE